MSKIKLFGNTGSRHAPRPRRSRRALAAAAAALALLAGLYCLAAFSDIPFIAKWRNIYIQTAMDTMNHQWLATAFLPKSVIDKAMASRAEAMEEQTQHNSSEDWGGQTAAPAPSAEGEEGFYELFWEIDRGSMEAYLAAHPEALDGGWERLCINEAGLDDEGTSIRTTMGEQVLAVDVPNGILLVRVSGGGYRGVLAVAKDPSRLSVRSSARLGESGQTAGAIAEANGGVLAMTASAFIDEGGTGSGGALNGYAMSCGVGMGDHLGWGYKRIELREDDRLYIVDASAPVDPATTDAVEFTPAVIVDGERLSAWGWDSLNPRAVIGQSRRGEILMLVIEGRLIDSLGVSVDECGAILERHECMQAMNLDGGTSAILWYDGESVTRCSNPALPDGRNLPNAFVYARAEGR